MTRFEANGSTLALNLANNTHSLSRFKAPRDLDDLDQHTDQISELSRLKMRPVSVQSKHVMLENSELANKMDKLEKIEKFMFIRRQMGANQGWFKNLNLHIKLLE